MADTITAFYSFSAGTKARSTQVNTNFNVYRGNLIPVDPNTAASASLTYDLGTTEYRWRDLYTRGLNLIGMTTTANLTLARNTGATGGSFDLNVGGVTAAAIQPGLILGTGFSRTFSVTTTGASTGQIILTAAAITAQRVDTTGTYTLASARFTVRANTVIEVVLLPTNTPPTLDCQTVSSSYISALIQFQRGQTTTAMQQIGLHRMRLSAHGATTAGTRLRITAPSPMFMWDTTAPAGECVFEVCVVGDINNGSGTTFDFSGYFAVREL